MLTFPVHSRGWCFRLVDRYAAWLDGICADPPAPKPRSSGPSGAAAPLGGSTPRSHRSSGPNGWPASWPTRRYRNFRLILGGPEMGRLFHCACYEPATLLTGQRHQQAYRAGSEYDTDANGQGVVEQRPVMIDSFPHRLRHIRFSYGSTSTPCEPLATGHEGRIPSEKRCGVPLSFLR